MKIIIICKGEGGRLRLMPNNKPLAQSPTLLQSSPRVAAKPPTTNTTPSTRRIFMTKCMYYLLCVLINE